jgi:ubiquinone/menaquinone biosynthesis C-methylase UbiE
MIEKGGDNGMRIAQGAPVTERGTATPHSETSQNEDVRQYWDQEVCGTYESVVGTLPELSREWFALVEQHRYAMEPFIHTFAQFPAHRGKTVLEVGVGAGTDHLQWARAGAVCYGVDLTQRAIDTTRAHLALHGLSSHLQRIDAETLPFPDACFDVVYSWGVIHHSAHPEQIIREIRRVLKPNGTFIGMLYARHSLVVFKLWVKHALLKGRPWRSWMELVADHMESPGTKAYTIHELNALWSEFSSCDTTQILTPYDGNWFPGWMRRFFPDRWGWFIAITARK